MGRSFSLNIHESIGPVTDSVSYQGRGGPGAKAALHDTGRVEFELAGRSPTNEEGAREACTRLVDVLNAQGSNWSNPVPVVDAASDVDAYSTDRSDLTRLLLMQVVRASSDKKLWSELQRRGSVERKSDAEGLAGELRAAIAKKSIKYPAAQKASLTLVLEGDLQSGEARACTRDQSSRRD